MGKKYKKNLKKKKIYEELQKIDSGKSQQQINQYAPTITSENSPKTEVKNMDADYSVTVPDLKKFLVISLSLLIILTIVSISEYKTDFLNNFGDKIFSQIGLFQIQ